MSKKTILKTNVAFYWLRSSFWLYLNQFVECWLKVSALDGVPENSRIFWRSGTTDLAKWSVLCSCLFLLSSPAYETSCRSDWTEGKWLLLFVFKRLLKGSTMWEGHCMQDTRNTYETVWVNPCFKAFQLWVNHGTHAVVWVSLNKNDAWLQMLFVAPFLFFIAQKATNECNNGHKNTLLCSFNWPFKIDMSWMENVLFSTRRVLLKKKIVMFFYVVPK